MHKPERYLNTKPGKPSGMWHQNRPDRKSCRPLQITLIHKSPSPKNATKGFSETANKRQNCSRLL